MSLRLELLRKKRPPHMIVSGLGATPADSVGCPWNARYTIASGKLLVDFRFNAMAEPLGRPMPPVADD